MWERQGIKLDKILSIIIPCYNVEKYIAECLESVCTAKDIDIEVICVNDGSTDSTLSIVEQWKQEDSRIIVINQENKGLSAARNQGMKIAKGEFIYFLDSDDKISDLATLRKCCKKMQENNLDLLIGAARSFYECAELKEKYPGFEKSYRIEHEYPNVIKGTSLMAQLRQNKEWATSQSARIYRRSFLEGNHVHYAEGMIHEDNYVSFQCMYLAERTTAVKDVLFERRVRENSIMTKKVTHRNVLGYVVNFIQDLYLISEYREQERPNTAVDFPLNVARYGIKRTYGLLDDAEKTLFEESLTEEQKFFFDTLVRGEIEVSDMLKSKNELLQQTKAQCQRQKNEISKLTNQISELQKECKRSDREQKKLKKKIENNEKKLAELKSSNSWKIGRIITWPVRKLKRIIRH